MAAPDPTYEEEQSRYGDVCVTFRTATKVTGHLITEEHGDLTGLMLWPASHLMCYFLSSRSFPAASSVLEFGCGIGKVGAVAALAGVSPVVVCTDCDDQVLALCEDNLATARSQLGEGAPLLAARNLRWGNDEAAAQTMQEFTGGQVFHTLIAADIIYPATTQAVLEMLFESARKLLRPEGKFYCSFVERDWNTPKVLIDAAEAARFRIGVVPNDSFLPQDGEELPVMMGAKLLVFEAMCEGEVASTLGGEACGVFPGFMTRYAELLEMSLQEPEEWDMPPCVDGD